MWLSPSRPSFLLLTQQLQHCPWSLHIDATPTRCTSIDACHEHQTLCVAVVLWLPSSQGCLHDSSISFMKACNAATPSKMPSNRHNAQPPCPCNSSMTQPNNGLVTTNHQEQKLKLLGNEQRAYTKSTHFLKCSSILCLNWHRNINRYKLLKIWGVSMETSMQNCRQPFLWYHIQPPLKTPRTWGVM